MEERHSTATPGRRTSRDISVGTPLPERLLVDRQFINAEGEPIRPHSSFSLPASAGGSGSSSGGNDGPVTKIRFLIGVTPKHQQVPFEFKQIPLPNPNP